jgi:hypothetical protein
MKPRNVLVAALVVMVALALGGIALAALDDGEGDVVSGKDGEAVPTDSVLDETGGSDGPNGEDRFVGLSVAAAPELADADGRAWRVARNDTEFLALTDDLMVGRVTFEIDDGIVTAASIERAVDQPPVDADPVEDPVRAELLAEAVERLLTVDNMFSADDPFDDIQVATVIGGDVDQPLSGLELEMIAAAIQDLGSVQFIEDAGAVRQALFEASQPEVAVSPDQVAVVSIDRVLLLDDRAEVEMSLWCGSLCGVYLTYEAVPQDGMWDITGIIGPVAVS